MLALTAVGLSAQTLEQAEALRKAHRYVDANEVFRVLVEKYPKNADYRERWGRLYMDVGQEDEAGKLFTEALEIQANHARALLGLAELADETYDSQAAELAHKALEADPKLFEAQELLARLALEDNDNAKAAAEAKKALAIDANAEQAKAILATMDWLADKKDTSWDPARRAAAMKPPAISSSSTGATTRPSPVTAKRWRSIPASYRARSELGVNLMRLGQDEEAYQQLETCFNNGFRRIARRKNSLTLMDSYKNFVTFRTDRTILKLRQERSRPAAPLFRSRNGARHRHLREEIPVSSWIARCRWRFIRTTRISRCARWACPAWARWA